MILLTINYKKRVINLSLLNSKNICKLNTRNRYKNQLMSWSKPIKRSTICNTFEILKMLIAFLLTECKVTVQDLLRISGRRESASTLSRMMKVILTWDLWSTFVHIVWRRIKIMKGSFLQKNFDSMNVVSSGKIMFPPMKQPPQLFEELMTGTTFIQRQFLQNNQTYNNMLSMLEDRLFQQFLDDQFLNCETKD